MKSNLLPRYLRVAHWLCEQGQWMSSRDVAVAFNVPPKFISDDFASIRKRPDIFYIDEKKIRCKGVQSYLIQVLSVRPYMLDGRRYPHRIDGSRMRPSTSVEWRDLLSRPWHSIDLQSESTSQSNPFDL